MGHLATAREEYLPDNWQKGFFDRRSLVGVDLRNPNTRKKPGRTGQNVWLRRNSFAPLFRETSKNPVTAHPYANLWKGTEGTYPENSVGVAGGLGKGG